MTVNVEVELDDFDTDDLISELECRLKYKSDKPKILEFCRESLGIENNIPKDNLLDEMKLQLVENNIHKFTLDELEIFFKSK